MESCSGARVAFDIQNGHDICSLGWVIITDALRLCKASGHQALQASMFSFNLPGVGPAADESWNQRRPPVYSLYVNGRGG